MEHEKGKKERKEIEKQRIKKEKKWRRFVFNSGIDKSKDYLKEIEIEKKG